MKAVVYTGKGQVEVLERPMPVPQPGESLLEISRAGICGTDLRIFQGHMQHRAGPGRILGHEMTAVIRESSGSGSFRQGDRVVVEPTLFCNNCQACRSGHTHVCQNLLFLGIDQDGAFQQFWSVPEHRLHKIGTTVPDDHAAMIEPLAVAVHDVRMSAVRAGETVAVIGGGTIGLLIALLAKKAGARVVVIEINPFRVDFAKELQLEAINPGNQDAAAFIKDFSQGAGADVVFEASGSAAAAQLMTSLAAVRGRIVIVGIQDRDTPTDLFQVFYRELTLLGARAYSGADFKESIRLISSGEMNIAPFISRHFPFEKMQEALLLALSNSPVMKVMIRFAT